MEKIKIYDINGKETKEISSPDFFDSEVRSDIIFKVLEAKRTWQAYGPNLMAGNNYSASGILKHHRKVWKSQYGRGISRVPRKIMTRRGSQFNWVGATVPNCRGGRRAHPPKAVSMINTNSINKKEMKLALISALSATSKGSFISKRYATLNDVKVENAPYVVESKITTLKAKELQESVKKILGEKLFPLAIKKRAQRAGKGKSRGRKYKSTAGLLIVVGEKETIKTTAFDVISAKKLSVLDLAIGGPGRITLYTEKAIKELEEKI
jgi:large subunit ribosomal protein L4e